MGRMKKLADWWKSNPAVRVAARQVAIAVASYVAAGIVSGFGDWRAFVASLITTTITTLLGLTTPLEPFVGINKPRNVQVPVPPAVKET